MKGFLLFDFMLNDSAYETHLPLLFSEGDVAPVLTGLPQKLALSGVTNVSAKLSLLQRLLRDDDAYGAVRRILILTHDKNEVYELQSLLPLFLGEEWSLHILPRIQQGTRDLEKCLWMQGLHDPEKKHLFLLWEGDERDERFPTQEVFHEHHREISLGQSLSPLELSHLLMKLRYSQNPDSTLSPGEYRRSGDIVDILPHGSEQAIKVEMSYDQVEGLWSFDPRDKQMTPLGERYLLPPGELPRGDERFGAFFSEGDLIITDDVEESAEAYVEHSEAKMLRFTPFPDDLTECRQMRFLSVLKFYQLSDLLSDLTTKLREEWRVVIFTKRTHELEAIFSEEGIQTSQEAREGAVLLVSADHAESVPPSFQSPESRMLFLTDREIFQLQRSTQQKSLAKLNRELLTSLKMGDYVIHLDHGIGLFLGVAEQLIDGNYREYLEIAYARGDKLFVPVDQADKVTRFLHEEEVEPKLHRLGSEEWKNIQKKAKKETEKIAAELLSLYAEREKAKKKPLVGDDARMRDFSEGFPYEETPGQIGAIRDVLKDMEDTKPMDRLVCGDVGFGKTEVAMRAAYKAVLAGRQVAVVTPVTILTQQHYDSFMRRMERFDVRVEMLSRFRSPAEQKVILSDLKKGKIDVIIGTHRLLQSDVGFQDLGLVVIDEEQRFGVQQKEKLKALRQNVDVLTMTATPIPRTLNFALNKLRDMSTITTPPPGRLPVISEVRRYSDGVLTESIEREIQRGGQIYVLYNKVESIESMAQKIRDMMPHVRVVVGHGQLNPGELEKRIVAFKKHEYDVLVSSTIIENGIDLPNANTLIVMHAERFGLAQLYQLRGRVGRGKLQAYAHFLYQGQKLSLEAKKRLKAIIEATELGSGFQIAMRDLEIRGAGEILGASQSGSVNTVGVGHFLRLLNQTIEEMRTGKKARRMEQEKDVVIELPIEAYIPNTYIADSKEKILAYQDLASVATVEELESLSDELSEEYGALPEEAKNLLKIIDLKIMARKAHITSVRVVHQRDVELTLGKRVRPEHIMQLLQVQSYWRIVGEKLKCLRSEIETEGGLMEGLKKSIGALLPQKKEKGETPKKEELVASDA